MRELDREREPEKKFTTPPAQNLAGLLCYLALAETANKIEGWSPSKINCLDPLPRFLKGGRPEKKLYATPLALVREGGRPSESHQTNESGPLRRSLPRSA